MKKLLLAFAVVAFFASCKKDYTCTCSNAAGSATVEYTGLNKSDADDAKTGCTSVAGCTWAEK